MPITKDPIRGSLVEVNVPETLKWGKPRDFIKLLTKVLAVTLPFAKNDDFVVYGPQTPSEDDKSRLWAASFTNGLFKGFFMFQKGSWRQIFNRLNNEIVWLPGRSTDIPKGYQLIDGTVSGISVPDQNHIMSFYKRDVSVLPPNAPVYTYFAVRWVGY